MNGLLQTMLLFITCGGCCAKLAAQTIARDANIKDSIYKYGKASEGGTGKFYQGREIAQVMDAAGRDWLERQSRQQEENAGLAIERIKLSPRDVVADIGAGTGYYSFRLSAKLPHGKVYAIEIQDALIRYLHDKKTETKDSVVEVIRGTEKSPNLPANSTDLAIMVDVYHELLYPHEMLQALRLALKQHGKILLIEYRGEDSSIPIKILHKTTVAQITRELGADGFRLRYKGEFLPIQHFLLFEKN